MVEPQNPPSHFLKTLKNLFAFPDPWDDIQKQSQTLLTVYIWMFMSIMTAGCILLIIMDPSQLRRPLLIILILNTLYSLFYYIMKTGKVQLASFLTIASTWLMLTGVVLTGGGVHSPAFSGYLMLTFLTGITLGVKPMMWNAIGSIIVAAGMEYLELTGLLPEARYQTTHFSFMLLQGIMLFMFVVLQFYASSLIKNSFQKAQDELKERKIIEQELSASQRRFIAIFENSPIPTAITTLNDLKLIDANAMFIQLYGYSLDELHGEQTRILRSLENQEQMLLLLNKNGFVRDFETSLRRKDNETRYVSVTIGKLNIDASDCLIFQVLDVTEKHNLAQSLVESNQRFAQLTRHIHEVFWVSEKVGKLEYVSPAFEYIFGFPAEDLYQGKDYIDLVHPDDRQIVIDSFEYDMRGENSLFEYRIIRPDGEIRWVSDRSYPILGEHGELIRTVGITTDITDQKHSEAERRELTSILEDAEQQVGLASWSQDVLTGKSKWSPYMFTLFGFDPAEGIPSMPDYLERIHPEDRELLGSALFKMMQGEETTEMFSYRTNPHYGEMRFLKPTYRTEKDANGRIIKFLGTVLDITEQKRGATELERRQKLLETVILAGKNITSIIDFDKCLQEIHRNIINNLGFERAGLFIYDPERHYVQGTYGTDRNGNSVSNDWYYEQINENSEWQIALESPTGIAVIDDYGLARNPPPDNEMYGVKQHITLAAWSGDKPVALISVDNFLTQKPITPADIEALQLFAGYAGLAIENARLHTGLETLVEERTDALSQSQKSLQLFLDTANDLIQSLDESGHYIYVNQSWCRTLGYTLEEANKLDMLQVVDKEYQVHCLNIFRNLMADGVSQIIEVGFRTKHDRLVIVEGSISVQVRADGKRVTNGFFRDVTERKQAEIAMQQANLEMEKALRMKDEFLANMSHELRTPLNAILGLSESLLEETVGSINSRQHKYLSTINENGRHLLELINDILDLAKIESGKIHLLFSSVNIKTLCETSLRIVDQLANSKNQTLHLEIADEVKYIQADERRLKQMVVNLLSNAIKFTPEKGQVGIRAIIDDASTFLNIEVWDTGIGIKQDDLSHIFQPFIQLNSGLARESSGTGLGLALVAQMARLHGGNITVRSEPGKGSSFVLSLPQVSDFPNTLEE
ncbi:MAG: PAS domain S-box protein [Anaerolineales bacterium]